MLAFAIELGGTHATCALVRDTEVLGKEPLCSSGTAGLAPMLPRFASAFEGLARQNDVTPRDCAGVVLGFCGLVDADAGRVLSTNGKYEDAPGLDLGAWSCDTFGLPFRMENDARLALLGERCAGAARGYDDVVMVTLGTGIGGAAMIGGTLLRGKHYQAGCLGGHLSMNPLGRPCSCGARGCAESEASTWALPGVCRDWPRFAESRLAAEEKPDFNVLFRVGDEGDLIAKEILQHCIDVWAALAVGLIHAYDPEVLVFGGGVMRRGDRILPAIRERAGEAWTPWGKVEVKPAECGDDAALLGAIPLLMEMK